MTYIDKTGPIPKTGTKWWLSCKNKQSGSTITVMVIVKNDKILWAPHVVQRFKGQPFSNLTNWMRNIGGFKQVKL